MYYAKRNGVWFNSYRKSYKKARWQKAYTREANRIKLKIFYAAFGVKYD